MSLLERHGVELVADVRTVPRSRRMPWFAGDALAAALPDHGVAYEYFRDLGGFRRPRPDSPNSGWQVEAFRGYADHMESAEFRDALVVRRLEVCHIRSDGRAEPHSLTPFAVPEGDRLTYPAPQTRLKLD